MVTLCPRGVGCGHGARSGGPQSAYRSAGLRAEAARRLLHAAMKTSDKRATAELLIATIETAIARGCKHYSESGEPLPTTLAVLEVSAARRLRHRRGAGYRLRLKQMWT
jgi:hypothetical protein